MGDFKSDICNIFQRQSPQGWRTDFQPLDGEILSRVRQHSHADRAQASARVDHDAETRERAEEVQQS